MLTLHLQAQTAFGAFQDNDWFNPNNWTNGLPAPGNDATIVGGVTAQIGSPLVIDFQLTNYGTLSIGASVEVTDTLLNVGTLVNAGALRISGTLQSVVSMTNQNTFSALPGAIVVISGTFDNQGTFQNEGTLTQNGTLHNAGQFVQKGQLQLNGSLYNAALLELQAGTLQANVGSQLWNAAAATLRIAGGATLRIGGTFLQDGQLEIAGSAIIDGQAEGTGTWTVLAGASLAANNQLHIEGTLINHGFVANSFQMKVAGHFQNSGFLQNGAYITVLSSGTLSNLTGGQIDNQYGAEVLVEGTLDNQAEFVSVGDIINKSDILNTGSIYANTGGTIDNSGTLHNNGFLSNIDQIFNTGSVFNYHTISNASGGVFTNDGTVYNYSAGRISNDFDLINNGQLISEGTIENGVRIHNYGTFTNDGLVINIGDFTNSPGASFVNNQVVENNAGGIVVNDGTMANYNEWFNNACAELVNNGLFVNDYWFTNKGLLFQNGTWSGAYAPMHKDGGVEIVGGTSEALCKSTQVGIGPDGQAIVTGALVAQPVLDNCDVLALTVNGQIQLAFDCAQVGLHVVTLELTDRLGHTASCTTKVEVVDNLAPVFHTCPTDVLVETTETETPVFWTEPQVSDNCALANISASHQPGDLFALGTTQVSYQAADVHGNSNACHFAVTVVPAGDCAEVRAIRRVRDTYDHCGTWCEGPYVLTLGDDECFTAGADLLFIEYHDGTALLTGSIFDEEHRGYVEVYFSGRTETPPSGSPKYGLCTQSGGGGWYFYMAFHGFVFLPDGELIELKRYGPAFQVGVGANLQDPALLGASGWFEIDDDDDHGDFNFRLDPEPLPCENSIWLEAECATARGAAWQLVQDAGASRGQTMRAPDKNRYHDPPTTDADKLRFEVAVAQPGNYRIFVRAKATSGSNDSYWVRVNGGAWVKWNKVNRIYGYPDAYAWDQVGRWDEDDYAVPLSFQLHGGVNTIEFAWREAGARIDKVLVTLAGKRPQDEGADAENCEGDEEPPVCNTDILFVVGDAACQYGDAAVLQHLQDRGFFVVVKEAQEVTLADAQDKGLILISSTVYSKDLGDLFAPVPVPVVTWEAWLYDDMGMTEMQEGQDYGTVHTAGFLTTDEAPYSLDDAAPEELVRVSDCNGKFSFGRPGDQAVRMAYVPDDPSQVLIFGYEAGAAMPGGAAAARRAALFLRNNTAACLTDRGWALFDATIDWAIGCAAPPAQDDDDDDETEVCNKDALFVVGNTSLSHGDKLVADRLEALGYELTIVEDEDVDTEDADDMGIVIISSTVFSGKVGEKFTFVEVPVFTWESWLFDDLHMTGSSKQWDFGKQSDRKKIKIVEGGHPITQGAVGKFKIYNGKHRVRWGRPQGEVDVLGLIPGTNKAMLFAYETGKWMRDMEAPARRVGFFLDDKEAKYLTSTGWALFDAAVDWAASCNQTSALESVPELLSLEAMRQGNRVELRWTNNTAWKNDLMVLQRSPDGVVWQTLQSWDAFEEEDDTPRAYRAHDVHPLEGSNYYRIQIRHLDGTMSFSPVRKVVFRQLPRLALYPNPAAEQVRIFTGDWAGKPARIALIDSKGHILIDRQTDALRADYEALDLRALPAGSYVVHVMVEGHRPISAPLIVQH